MDGIVFLERLQDLVKISQEKHLRFCSDTEHHTCRFRTFYKVVLFYLKNELDYQERNLPFVYFKRNERRELDQTIEEMVSLIQAMKTIDRSNFMKLKLELYEMKSYYFLDKKNWRQLFLGKVMVLEHSRIITHEQSSTLLKRIEERFAS